MALVLNDIIERVRVLGKDQIGRFTTQISQAIGDTCVEICLSEDLDFLYSTDNFTVTALDTWISLGATHLKLAAVTYQGQPLAFVSEVDYMQQASMLAMGSQAFYRRKWSGTAGLYQLRFEKGPAAGSTVQILWKMFTDDVTKFPEYMEEAIVKGALSRFMRFQEGDDLVIADREEQGYVGLVKTVQSKVTLESPDTRPRTGKTNKQLDRERQAQYGYR